MKFLKELWNRIRGLDNKVAKSIKNNVENAELKIEDADKKVSDFEDKINLHLASLIKLKAELQDVKKEITKWQSIAEKAANKGNREDAHKALIQKSKLVTRSNQLEQAVKINETQTNKFVDQRNSLRDQLRDAKQNLGTLAAREQSAKLARELSASSDGMSSINLGLGEFESEVKEQEYMAQANEILCKNPSDDLDKKYSGNEEDIQVELDALMGGK